MTEKLSLKVDYSLIEKQSLGWPIVAKCATWHSKSPPKQSTEANRCITTGIEARLVTRRPPEDLARDPTKAFQLGH